MPVAPPLAASARSLLVAGLPTVAHPAERAAVITIKIATVTRTPRAPSKQPYRTEEYRPKVLPDTLTPGSMRDELFAMATEEERQTWREWEREHDAEEARYTAREAAARRRDRVRPKSSQAH